MPCIWSPKANVIIQGSIAVAKSAGRKTLALKNCRSAICHIGSQPYVSPTSSYHSFRQTPPLMESPALPQPCPQPQPPTTVLSSASPTIPSPFVIDHLTSAQISRASAAAVRISVARGDIWDGFHLWHSLRWSMHHYHKPGPSTTPQLSFRSPISTFVPIDFGRPVSTRFAGHCLLHGLLRAGETKTAAMLTEQMMTHGEELNPLSFNILLRQLHPFARPDSSRNVYDHRRNLIPRQKMPFEPRILDLQNVMLTDPLTSFAVRLLSKAREHRWQRTTGMYESVLRACLIQGEILVASLLLALLLKDYQLGRTCSRVAAEAESVGAQDTMAYVHSKVPEAPFRGFKLLPYRSSRFLYQSVAQFLEKHCAHVDDPLFPEASQALANLAAALDDHRIPYANLSTLIKVLYSYPQCRHNIWVTLPSGKQQSCNAYRYFHGVLLNLFYTLPDRRSFDLDTSQLPALNLDSYNALLNYAMRYRHSLALADRVLHHMTELRKPPLAPSIATYNTLLRGSTLMRRNDIAERVLRIVPLPWRISGRQLDASLHHFPPRMLQGWNSQVESCPTKLQLKRHCRRFNKLLEDTGKGVLNIPKPRGPLEPDNTLLTSYMAHLIATGRPDTVAIIITRVLPEFEPPKEKTPEELIARWETSVIRSVTLGPYFFAVALNGLRKAGLWRVAERVWALAHAAEAKSLQSSGTTPWCLSVHAYTAMLQLYAHETRGWHVDHTATCAGHPPRPRDPRRAISAMQKGMQVFRTLPLAAEKVREAAMQAQEEGREWKHAPSPPKADARFYNAALSLIYRRPGTRKRGSRQGSRSQWNRRLIKARRRFLVTGQKPRGWMPELEEIAESLRSSGYALPVGFELRLVGRDEQATSQDKVDLDARPFSFGRRARGRFAPHRIPTAKRKGLPLHRRWRRLGWSRMACVDTPEGHILAELNH
ncbi:hypothetical protein BJV74DRAFT_951105 [Russula compacta]|nr:hypothetical protein BJV74DRAFT_951105 [Russula compacta]